MNILIQRLLAFKADYEDFSEIVFIIIIAVFWIAGAIIKGASKKGQKAEKTVEENKLSKASGMRLQPQIKQKYRFEDKRLKHIAKKIASQKVSKEESKEEINNFKLPEFKMPEIQTEYTKKQIVPLKSAELSIVESLLKLENSEDLKKGILYYEVLGKPLSLRSEEKFF